MGAIRIHSTAMNGILCDDVMSEVSCNLILQSSAKYLEQNRETEKAGQEKKSLISTFVCFVTVIDKV